MCTRNSVERGGGYSPAAAEEGSGSLRWPVWTGYICGPRKVTDLSCSRPAPYLGDVAQCSLEVSVVGGWEL